MINPLEWAESYCKMAHKGRIWEHIKNKQGKSITRSYWHYFKTGKGNITPVIAKQIAEICDGAITEADLFGATAGTGSLFCTYKNYAEKALMGINNENS